MIKIKRLISIGLLVAFTAGIAITAHISYRKKLYSRENMIIETPEEMKYLFIGDSRTMGLYLVSDGGKEDSVGWIAEGGIKLDWFKEYAEPIAREKIKKNTKLVVLLGVNDILGEEFGDKENSGVDDYAETLERIADKYSKKGVETYFVSVLPVDSSYSELNADVEKFNDEIRKRLDECHYIDLYSEIINEDFKTVDGLHFDVEISTKIYDKLLRKLK
ncbi:SGNH/GDSL hydrolase family protein [Lachnospiraceae bacterium C1.1]|nr:hypothetical protein [Lachnospiraceae bacterium C1.1]